MIFEALNAAATMGDLLLWDGGLCHYHCRLDGQTTICELIVLPERRGQGIGRRLIGSVIGIARQRACTSVLAKCPADLPANGFYEHLGFRLETVEQTRTGRKIHVWRLLL